jgi:hypothetical protein
MLLADRYPPVANRPPTTDHPCLTFDQQNIRMSATLEKFLPKISVGKLADCGLASELPVFLSLIASTG